MPVCTEAGETLGQTEYSRRVGIPRKKEQAALFLNKLPAPLSRKQTSRLLPAVILIVFVLGAIVRIISFVSVLAIVTLRVILPVFTALFSLIFFHL